MTTRERLSDVWVCVDCYFAHHYGATEHDGQWFAGESDTPCDREPLADLDGYEVSDHTCSDHEGDYWSDDPCPHCGEAGDENGIDEFSWRRCDGCGSTLGGARYRLAVWEVAA